MPQQRNELLFRLKYFKFAHLIATEKNLLVISLSAPEASGLKSKNNNNYEFINTNYGGNKNRHESQRYRSFRSFTRH